MILLVQFRTDQSGWHEIKCIYEASPESYKDLHIVNVNTKNITSDMMLEYVASSDRIILGGYAESGYEEKNMQKRKRLDHIREILHPVIGQLVHDDTKPVLGICFGAQLIAEALGGEVAVDPEQAEAGVISLELTDAGMVDSLFKGMKQGMRVISGHKASITRMPENAVLLARSDLTDVHAFRIGRCVYGASFHAELGFEDFMERLRQFPEYAHNKGGSRSSEVVDGTQILKNFLKM